jgi:hypothetical protein
MSRTAPSRPNPGHNSAFDTKPARLNSAETPWTEKSVTRLKLRPDVDVVQLTLSYRLLLFFAAIPQHRLYSPTVYLTRKIIAIWQTLQMRAQFIEPSGAIRKIIQRLDEANLKQKRPRGGLLRGRCCSSS